MFDSLLIRNAGDSFQSTACQGMRSCSTKNRKGFWERMTSLIVIYILNVLAILVAQTEISNAQNPEQSAAIGLRHRFCYT